jgi:PAS domain-containing protein
VDGFVGKEPNRGAAARKSSSVVLFPQQRAVQLIYDTAPIGLACLSPDCRYLQINQRLTEICGISVEDHLGRCSGLRAGSGRFRLKGPSPRSWIPASP